MGISQTNKIHDAKPISLRFDGDDAALAAGIKRQHPGAMEALFDRYGKHVAIIVNRLLGVDAEAPDLIQDVFVAAFSRISTLRDDTALKQWLSTLAVFTVRQRIRKRSRRRVYWQSNAQELIENTLGANTKPTEVELLKLTYRILDTMPLEERIVFSLRFIEGMEISEVAEICDVSLSTVKRRQKKAERRFITLAAQFPGVMERINNGGRWSTI